MSNKLEPEPAPVPASMAGVEMKLTPWASIYINTGNSQNQGARTYQEDAFGYSNIIDSSVVSSKGILAVLSDGMGGLSNGKSVADYVVQTSLSLFETLDPRKNISAQLENMIRVINDQICERYTDNGVSRAGATAVLAYFFKNRIYWVTAGDSRLYCFRNGHMLQLNEDHDYKNQLYRAFLAGEGSLLDAETDGQKDSLVSFMGKKGLPCVDISRRGYRVQPEDIFVLCSDGIYNGISSDTMKDILSSCDAQDASERIVSDILASHFPGQDNMTVLVIKCQKKR